MGMLKKSGLVHVIRGKAGATLAHNLSEITLFYVYKAVNDNNLFIFKSSQTRIVLLARTFNQQLNLFFHWHKEHWKKCLNM
ncbi:Transcriptional regulator [compost metagenome]